MSLSLEEAKKELTKRYMNWLKENWSRLKEIEGMEECFYFRSFVNKQSDVKMVKDDSKRYEYEYIVEYVVEYIVEYQSYKLRYYNSCIVKKSRELNNDSYLTDSDENSDYWD